jgi:hypothetical protein
MSYQLLLCGSCFYHNLKIEFSLSFPNETSQEISVFEVHPLVLWCFSVHWQSEICIHIQVCASTLMNINIHFMVVFTNDHLLALSVGIDSLCAISAKVRLAAFGDSSCETSKNPVHSNRSFNSTETHFLKISIQLGFHLV